MQRDPFATGEYYHIFNRGTDKRKIFSTSSDYKRFINSMIRFNTTIPSWKMDDQVEVQPRLEDQLVDIAAYCLNPNHFHFILRQKKDSGISEFMRKLGTGYTMYFNKINSRTGVLFQGRFKSVHINSNEYLLYLSAYVNCNNDIHEISSAKNYAWTSFGEYCGKESGPIGCYTNDILGQFKNFREYEDFALIQAKEMKNKKEEMRGMHLE